MRPSAKNLPVRKSVVGNSAFRRLAGRDVPSTDDDPGNTHLGETIDVVDQLTADDRREETLRLF
jgi:hypothetical protein